MRGYLSFAAGCNAARRNGAIRTQPKSEKRGRREGEDVETTGCTIGREREERYVSPLLYTWVKCCSCGGKWQRGREGVIYCVSAGLVKCLCCGDNWVAVGSTGGTVSTLDLRMGALLHQWRPSEFNLVPVCIYILQ